MPAARTENEEIDELEKQEDFESKIQRAAAKIRNMRADTAEVLKTSQRAVKATQDYLDAIVG